MYLYYLSSAKETDLKIDPSSKAIDSMTSYFYYEWQMKQKQIKQKV